MLRPSPPNHGTQRLRNDDDDGHLYVGVAVLQHRTANALPVAMFMTDII